MSQSLLTLGLLAALALPAFADEKSAKESSPGKDRVFEMRTYYTHEGRLPALNKRFREHTTALFEKHGMELMGFYTPIGGEGRQEHDKLDLPPGLPEPGGPRSFVEGVPGRPRLAQAAREASEKDGKIVKPRLSLGLPCHPTDYSTDQMSRRRLSRGRLE